MMLCGVAKIANHAGGGLTEVHGIGAKGLGQCVLLVGSTLNGLALVPSNSAQIINLKSSCSRALTFDVIRLLALGPNQSHALGAKFPGQDCKDIPSHDITNVKKKPRAGGYVIDQCFRVGTGPARTEACNGQCSCQKT